MKSRGKRQEARGSAVFGQTALVNDALAQKLRNAIAIDAGIGDMWPVFGDAELLKELIEEVAAPFQNAGVTKVVGVEARGFVLGAAVAARLNAGFVGIRKPGGLYPGDTFECRSPADYRGNEFVLRLQKAALNSADCVILVDDWFETGGQARTALNLIGQSGATYLGASVVVNWLTPEIINDIGPVYGVVDAQSLPSGV